MWLTCCSLMGHSREKPSDLASAGVALGLLKEGCLPSPSRGDEKEGASFCRLDMPVRLNPVSEF